MFSDLEILNDFNSFFCNLYLNNDLLEIQIHFSGNVVMATNALLTIGEFGVGTKEYIIKKSNIKDVLYECEKKYYLELEKIEEKKLMIYKNKKLNYKKLFQYMELFTQNKIFGFEIIGGRTKFFRLSLTFNNEYISSIFYDLDNKAVEDFTEKLEISIMMDKIIDENMIALQELA